MKPLRQRMIEDLEIRNYSRRTIAAYVHCVAAFARFCGKSPQQLGREDVRRYQKHLVDRQVSWAHFNQTTCGLRFLYRTTLNRQWMIEHIPFPKREKRLPVVLSQEELATFFGACPDLRCRTALQVMYGAGLRLSEALWLEVDDVDSKRNVLRVRLGKGKKDRYVPLSETLLEILRTYWKVWRPKALFFAGRIPGQPLHATAVQRICKLTGQMAGISKPVKTQTMRHCFATHLVEAGVDLKTIQFLLGHRSLNTTSVYVHVANRLMRAKDGGPVDLLGALEVSTQT